MFLLDVKTTSHRRQRKNPKTKSLSPVRPLPEPEVSSPAVAGAGGLLFPLFSFSLCSFPPCSLLDRHTCSSGFVWDLTKDAISLDGSWFLTSLEHRWDQWEHRWDQWGYGWGESRLLELREEPDLFFHFQIYGDSLRAMARGPVRRLLHFSSLSWRGGGEILRENDWSWLRSVRCENSLLWRSVLIVVDSVVSSGSQRLATKTHAVGVDSQRSELCWWSWWSSASQHWRQFHFSPVSRTLPLETWVSGLIVIAKARSF